MLIKKIPAQQMIYTVRVFALVSSHRCPQPALFIFPKLRGTRLKGLGLHKPSLMGALNAVQFRLCIKILTKMESSIVHGVTLRTISSDEQAAQKMLKERLRAKHRLQRKEFIEQNQDLDYSNFNKQVLLQIDKEYEKIQPQIDDKPIISAYWPTKFELDCRSLLKELHSQNKWRVCLPVTQGDRYPLIFREYKEGDELEKGEKFKVLEPTPDKEQLKPHLLIVPLIAFTSDCFRIGYGKGHYDMTLESLGDVKTIGVAFDSQKADIKEGYIPEAHDKQLDCIITEKDIYFP